MIPVTVSNKPHSYHWMPDRVGKAAKADELEEVRRVMIEFAVLHVFLIVLFFPERGAQMITIRFVAGNDLTSRVIRLAEYGFWATHVETLMPDGTLLGAHASDGVQARPKDYDRGGFSRQLLVPIPATPEQTDEFHAFLRSQIGKPYDFEAIVGIVAQCDWRNDKAWMCSELVAAGLCQDKVGIFPPHLATELNHVTPRDLLLIVSGRYELAA